MLRPRHCSDFLNRNCVALLPTQSRSRYPFCGEGESSMEGIMDMSGRWHLRVNWTSLLDGTLLVTGVVSALSVAMQLI